MSRLFIILAFAAISVPFTAEGAGFGGRSVVRSRSVMRSAPVRQQIVVQKQVVQQIAVPVYAAPVVQRVIVQPVYAAPVIQQQVHGCATLFAK